MRKRSFILLEVLIAVSLISLCAVPLVVRPLQIYRAEMNLLWEIEGERLADWSFSEIKEKLLKNEIPWKKLPDKEEKELSFSLPDAIVSIPGGKQRKIKREFILTCRRDDEGFKGEVYRMFEVRMIFTPQLLKKKPLYRIMAQKLIEQKEPPNDPPI